MLPTNQQTIEKQDLQHDGALQVFRIWKTIQGEGPWAGRPAIFVRLSGCNLQCPQCDTDYTSKRELMPVDSLMNSILVVCPRTTLIVITGGEPFRQNIKPFVASLLKCGYDVQIETNGTLWLDDFENLMNSHLMIVCSPKTAKVHPNILKFATAWKYVVETGHVGSDGLPTRVLGSPCQVARPGMLFHNSTKRRVYVQPLDEQNEQENRRHQATALSICLNHGYTFCMQQHKLLGLD